MTVCVSTYKSSFIELINELLRPYDGPHPYNQNLNYQCFQYFQCIDVLLFDFVMNI